MAEFLLAIQSENLSQEDRVAAGSSLCLRSSIFTNRSVRLEETKNTSTTVGVLQSPWLYDLKKLRQTKVEAGHLFLLRRAIFALTLMCSDIKTCTRTRRGIVGLSDHTDSRSWGSRKGSSL